MTRKEAKVPLGNHEVRPLENSVWVCDAHGCALLMTREQAIEHAVSNQFIVPK
jgi:hypothetical protein